MNKDKQPMNKNAHGFAIAAMLALGVNTICRAEYVDEQKELGVYFKRDLTSAQFSAEYQTMSAKNFLMTDIEAYDTANGMRYSMLWQANSENRGWAIKRDMTATAMADEVASRRDQGFRLVDVEAYALNGEIRWAGIWLQNTENFLWTSHRGQTSEQFSSTFQSNKAAGYRIVEIGAYNTAQGTRFNSLWQKNTDNRQWVVLRDMSREQYESNTQAYFNQGYNQVDMEAYDSPYGTSYAAIWEKRPGLAHVVKTDRDSQSFTNLFYENADKGYRLVDFERYVTSDGVRYAGLWQENNARFRYTHKTEIDNVVTDYRTVNNLPGISVVLIRNGDMFYRRGFGWADIDGNKSANASTVYNMASLSKVVAGTLAAKLEQNQKLEDGTTFQLNLDNRVDNSFPLLPAQHTYSTADLLAHLGCIQHYGGIADQTVHYDSATAAMSSITSQPLVSPCTIGSSYNYSTHAFTIVGAMLERRTGKNISELVRTELSEPYGLSSLRAQFENENLTANSLRATPYTVKYSVGSPGSNFNPPDPVDNPNVETTYTDSSWKVLGGGLESSTSDLARFGWKTLNGEIVSASSENNVRDNRLWDRVNKLNPKATHGLGWGLGTTISGKSIALWNGSWPGARTYLRVYRNDGFVIAIMSNRRNHRNDINYEVNDLADKIENIVLTPERAGF